MTDDDDAVAARRWPWALGLAAALVWLGIAAALAVAGAQNYDSWGTAPWRDVAIAAGSFILQLLPPLAVAILAFALLRRSRPDTARHIAAIETRHEAAAAAADHLAASIARIDEALDRIEGRVGSLRVSADAEGRGLTASATRLDSAATSLLDSARRAGEAGAALGSQLPAATAQAHDLASILADSGTGAARQLTETQALLSAVAAAIDDAAKRHDSAAQAAQTRLADLGSAAQATAAKVGEQSAALAKSVTAALDGTTQAVDTTRAAVEVQTAALLASVDQARVAIDHIGGEAAKAIQARLDAVIGTADALGQRLADQDARSRSLADTVTRDFTVLDAKLANAAATGNATLDTLTARLALVTGAIHNLTTPLGVTHDAVLEIETAVGRLEAAAAAVVASLGTDLPATREGVADLAAGVALVSDSLAALDAPVAATHATVTRIGEQLGEARGTAEGVETATGSAALTASTQLIEVLARVREVANATMGTMRETLGAVVAEAEAALEGAGTTRARTAFAAPIAAEIGRVEAATLRAGEAAQAATERVTQRLLALTKTVATVEARIDEVDTRYEVALRDDIAKRSEALLASLQAAAIDLTKLLSIDVGDAAWGAYLKGDRSIFARRAVQLLDRNTARKVARHFEHDAPFREQATRFITEFEALLKQTMPSREGKTLAVTLLSSDIGKLYVVLAQATERLR